MGVIMGTGVGGQDMFVDMIRSGASAGRMRSRPVDVINGLPNMPAFHVSNVFGFRGPLNTVATACAAGTQAIGVGTEEIRRGAADVMVVGGTEAMISEVFFATFVEAMRAVTTQNDDPPRAAGPSTPRAMALSSARGLPSSCWRAWSTLFLACGARDLYVVGAGLGRVCRRLPYRRARSGGQGRCALYAQRAGDAGISPDEVSYINVHAAGTPLGDAYETKGIKDVFGDACLRDSKSAPPSRW